MLLHSIIETVSSAELDIMQLKCSIPLVVEMPYSQITLDLEILLQDRSKSLSIYLFFLFAFHLLSQLLASLLCSHPCLRHRDPGYAIPFQKITPYTYIRIPYLGQCCTIYFASLPVLFLSKNHSHLTVCASSCFERSFKRRYDETIRHRNIKKRKRIMM